MKRLLAGAAGLAGALAGGWVALVRAQGDSLMAFEPQALSDVTTGHGGRSLTGEIGIVNRGKVGGVVHKVEGRVAAGPPGRVLVTRKGTRVPEPGWWQSNCLVPGESCVAEVDVDLDDPATGPVTIELDIHEVGRRLKVHRVVQLTVDPAVVPAGG